MNVIRFYFDPLLLTCVPSSSPPEFLAALAEIMSLVLQVSSVPGEVRHYDLQLSLPLPPQPLPAHLTSP